MDLFFTINWQQLKSLIGDLEIIAYNTFPYNGKAKLELSKLLYLIETDLSEIKKKLDLPALNPNIRSDSVVESFKRLEYYSEIFEREKIILTEYYRSNDYQYWLLIFLLIKNNHIRSNKLTLYKIVDEFVERIKNNSFSLEDIELTGSGVTRCKTNLRFAFADLKDLGLLYLYDKRHKNSWTLTYIGFFVAASFCFYPVDKECNPLGKKITRFHQSTYYYKINRYLLDRTKELSNPLYFKELIKRLQLESLGLKELEKGPDLFKLYYESITNIFSKEYNEVNRQEKLSSFLVKLDLEYPLKEYMEELSLKFDAEAFFNSIKGSFL